MKNLKENLPPLHRHVFSECESMDQLWAFMNTHLIPAETATKIRDIALETSPGFGLSVARYHVITQERLKKFQFKDSASLAMA